MTDEPRWSEPFVAMIESLGMGPRLARGRRDARAGHVRSLTINSSLVVAQVRGPEETVAHRARIAVRAYGAAEWARIEDHLAAEARYAADLLVGRMPADIARVCAALGLPLLPESIGDIAMDCTCDDPVRPCPHLAATCYALAASLDTDPFGMVAWRGRSREELLARLRPAAPAAPSSTPSPAAVDLASFWDAPPPAAPGADAGALGVQVAIVGLPGVVRRPDALLDELGPLVVDGADITGLLRPLYRRLGP
ncbi:SWIM zinc finger family protein [Spirilliplanes yamanashiensis]|uniref:SWIM-type domain-containing protein n=1 Tax=Spirilliplanes yamanashiensis TaxID=42233 RepID=A0A8J3YAS6_9ACTN|nr:hypothetical protein [Spirilliplanes yamanashiensis]MDP9817669.1 putative Zn finger protein [Spirilliplanes yamanashiensis]GIJ04479.1 hypothetical protein Sya03_38310 [Spirilliplanes yamanashiensis]